MSGIIAILTSAKFMSHYLFYNLSATGKLSSINTFNMISSFNESLIYIYLGIVAWHYFDIDR